MWTAGSGFRLGIAAIAGAMAVGWSGQAMALSGFFPPATFPLGSCNVSIELDDMTETAKVLLLGPSFEAAGGAVFDSFTIDSGTYGSISATTLQSCGLTNIQSLAQDGANGSFASDGYIGFDFQAVDGLGGTNHYQFALSGASGTFPIFTTTVITPPPPPPPPPVVTGPTVQQTVQVVQSSQMAVVNNVLNSQPKAPSSSFSPPNTDNAYTNCASGCSSELASAAFSTQIRTEGGYYAGYGQWVEVDPDAFDEALKPSVQRNAVETAGLALALVSRNTTLSGSEATGTLNSQHTFGPVWTALSSSWSGSGSADTRYTLATIGAQTQVNDFTALGFMIQADNQSFEDGAATNDSIGWLAGPYVAAALPATGMQFQARALWGKTDNEISPDGSYTDQYDARRSLAMVDLSGPVLAGPTTMALHIGAAYSSMTSDAYTDNQGQVIPSVATAIARSTFGVNFSRQLDPAGDTVLTGNLDGNWTSTVTGPAVDYEGASATASVGITHKFEKGQIGASVFHSGIGNGGMTTTGASLNFAMKF
ncbi:MAG TPA: hypothetical protein PK450_10915 [Paracoccaceae bacterium]|nr:hypothetical protein [Paracoccaceae bacterium]